MKARLTLLLIALVATVLTAGEPAGPAAAGSAPLVVVAYPGPGWGYASPQTGITFRGVAKTELGEVRATGSISGEHPGTVHALGNETGAVFTPDTPFAPGERVSVTVGADVRVHDSDANAFSFMTSRSPPAGSQFGEPLEGRRERQSAPAPGGCHPKRRRFHTMPSLRPVAYCTVVKRGARLAPGRLVVSPTPWTYEERQPPDSVMMLSSEGKLLWYLPRPDRAHDAKVVTYDGRRLIAYFQRSSDGRSYYELRDEHYDVATRLYAGNGYRINSHELTMTPRGTAYVSAYVNVVMRNGRTVVDYVVQEIDMATRDVLFEWHALDHVPPRLSYAHRPAGERAWDYFHGNTIEPAPNGGSTLVVSARNTSALYGIDGVTGTLLWTLGGRGDDFGIQSGHRRWRFCAQHDPRWLPNGNLMVFDNGGAALSGGTECPRHPARVQEFSIDPASRTARLVRTISSRSLAATPRGYFPGWVGSARGQPGGNVLIDWGTTGQITEVDRRGRVVLRLRLGGWSYRAVRDPWVGSPRGRPVAAARRAGGVVDVWASWNGATEISHWQVVAGALPTVLSPVGEPVAFADLETHLRVPTARQFVAVRALDASGAGLGESEAVPAR